MARIERLEKLQPKTTAGEPGVLLNQQLKLSAGPSEGRSVVAPYRMMLTAKGPQNLVALKGADGDHGKPDPKKDLARMERAIPKTWIPAGSSARLLRSAVLNCHQDVHCS
jgi:hypothetical protein